MSHEHEDLAYEESAERNIENRKKVKMTVPCSINVEISAYEDAYDSEIERLARIELLRFISHITHNAGAEEPRNNIYVIMSKANEGLLKQFTIQTELTELVE